MSRRPPSPPSPSPSSTIPRTPTEASRRSNPRPGPPALRTRRAASLQKRMSQPAKPVHARAPWRTRRELRKRRGRLPLTHAAGMRTGRTPPREATPSPHRKRLLHAAPPPFPSSPPPRPRQLQMRRRRLRMRPHRRARPRHPPRKPIPRWRAALPPKRHPNPQRHPQRHQHQHPHRRPRPRPRPSNRASRPRACSPHTPKTSHARSTARRRYSAWRWARCPSAPLPWMHSAPRTDRPVRTETIRGTRTRFTFELPMDNGCSVLVEVRRKGGHGSDWAVQSLTYSVKG